MNSLQKKKLLIQDLGFMSYEDAYSVQMKSIQRVMKGGDECLLLCEHPAVITMGRVAKQENISAPDPILAKYKIKKIAVDRGGDVTFHGPGQLVAYPILDLKRRKQDLHLYIREIEQVAIDFLEDFGILAFRIFGYTGVWYKQKKIASIGIAVRRWVTYHGLAINLNMDLDLFSLIKPCGLDVQMTSVREIVKKDINFKEAKTGFAEEFCKIFHFQPIEEKVSCERKS